MSAARKWRIGFAVCLLVAALLVASVAYAQAAGAPPPADAPTWVWGAFFIATCAPAVLLLNRLCEKMIAVLDKAATSGLTVRVEIVDTAGAIQAVAEAAKEATEHGIPLAIRHLPPKDGPDTGSHRFHAGFEPS